MAKTCNYQDCNNPVFSKGYCKWHQQKKPIKKVSSKRKLEIDDKIELLRQDKLFYQQIWDDTEEHFCYECGTSLGSEPLTIYFHHLLPKRNYPQFRHNKDNIVLLCWQHHTQVELHIDKCPKTKLLTSNTELCLLNQ